MNVIYTINYKVFRLKLKYSENNEFFYDYLLCVSSNCEIQNIVYFSCYDVRIKIHKKGIFVTVKRVELTGT